MGVGAARVATLILREVDDEVALRLKARAEAAGRSAEAEHRRILEEALRPRRTGLDLAREMRASGPALTDEKVELFDRRLDQPVEHPDLPE